MVRPSRRTPRSSVEFFKIFLSSYSSHQLSLPPAVGVKLSQINVPENATLKDNFGKIWHVQLQKTERGLFIREGWQEFVCHHALVDADFLTFKYDGSSQFYVKVFGTNGLEKETAKANCKDSSACMKEEIETETKEEIYRSQSNRGCKRKYQETTRRSGQFGGSCSNSREHVDSTGKFKMAKAGFFVSPKNPHFEFRMTRTTRYYVYVHRSVLKQHNIKLQENTRLRDENGKLWPVKVYYRKDKRITISDGWLDFRREHNVELHDQIIFELVPEENNLCNLIHVHIVRNQP